MRLHIGICDDEALIRQEIGRKVKVWGKQRGHHLTLEEFTTAEQFLFHYEEDKRFDILLLDIEMKNINGVELAKRIRQEDKDMIIIFITGYMEYIADGYDVEALNFLLKPLREEKLFQVLDKATHRLDKQEKVLYLKSDNMMHRIPLSDILYFSVEGNELTVHMEREKLTLQKTLREVEEETDSRFFRVGRSYIVNLTAVTKVSRQEVFLKDGSCVPLSRGKYDLINRALIEYF